MISGNKHVKLGTGLMIGGIFLLFLSALLVCYNLWDNYRAQTSSDEILRQVQYEAAKELDDTAGAFSQDIPLYMSYPKMEMPMVVIDGCEYIGEIDIPSLGLALPVMSEWSYPNLKRSPCRYSGSAYQNNLVIAAHNYKSHFGTIKNLNYGDSVIFTDMDGNVFEYKVIEIEQLSPTDVDEMKNSEWDLTLFTCTMSGSNRVTIRCVLEE